jgi:N-methylhydantoinase A/oxoprolinase/acetone carboxylase beta subunit
MTKYVRMGIDVGGTHTKAVAIDNQTHKIIGKSSVKTTHDDPLGVAAGVVKVFINCLHENAIDPKDVVFVAHSTTQATNALLEGDVANVGVIGVAKGGLEGYLAKKQTRVDDIDLGTGKIIKIINTFIKRKQLTEKNITNAIDSLMDKGAEVIVASMAFGVDNMTQEQLIYKEASKRSIPATMGAEITKLYGLSRRTKTAAINASILPKMLETATSTNNSVRAAGIEVPLMIMRGDGGVMDISEMKKRPVLTMLSGPAASVMGALMYLRASNGIYFEVGGTSTNIGVIKNGRPAIDYSVVGGHSTYVNSLDVIVLGVAGGSMVRAHHHKIVDVGPRSAHIGGKDYAVFTDENEIQNPTLEFFSPKEGDPSDYVAIRLENGKLVTITNSCAANVLGLVTKEHFSYGNVNSARKAMKPLAEYLGLTIEETAQQILQKSFEKIEPVIKGLAEKYKLEKDQISFVGVGGGAASLLIYCAEKMNLKYSIPKNAEVISSIGVALSIVRDVVERILPNPTKEEIQSIKTEAINKAIESGATPESIEVHVEIDSQTQKVTAISTGSTEVKTTDLLSACSLHEALTIAAEDMRMKVEDVVLLETSDYFYIIGTATKDNIRIVDKKGFIRVQRASGIVSKTKVADYLKVIEQYWESCAVYKTDLIIRPDYYICFGPRLMDFSTTEYEQLLMLIDLELSMLNHEEEILIVAANQKQ